MAQSDPIETLTLDERVKRLEQILAGLGEVLKAGDITGGSWLARPGTSKVLATNATFDTILYNLGEALTLLNPPCPPWCGAIEEPAMPEEPEAPPEPEKEGDEPESK